MKEIELNFLYSGKPEAYARERKGRGTHFYNPKGEKMRDFRAACKRKLTKEQQKKLLALLSDCKAEYYVELDLDFFFPIPKSDSKKLAERKRNNEIRPAIRPDIDNFIKFVMDALHEVAYDDDKRVIKISAQKFFSDEPKTEVNIKIRIAE